MKLVLLSCLVCIPVAFWTLYKPTRVLAPELAGVPCASDVICLDDMSRYEEAVELYSDAYEFVNSIGFLLSQEWWVAGMVDGRNGGWLDSCLPDRQGQCRYLGVCLTGLQVEQLA